MEKNSGCYLNYIINVFNNNIKYIKLLKDTYINLLEKISNDPSDILYINDVMSLYFILHINQLAIKNNFNNNNELFNKISKLTIYCNNYNSKNKLVLSGLFLNTVKAINDLFNIKFVRKLPPLEILQDIIDFFNVKYNNLIKLELIINKIFYKKYFYN